MYKDTSIVPFILRSKINSYNTKYNMPLLYYRITKLFI